MPELNGKLKGNMDRFEIDESDSLIAKDFKQQLLSQNSSRSSRGDRKKEFEERRQLRKKLKKMKFKKRKEFLSKIEMDELNADYSRIRKVKRNKLSENDLDF